MTTVIMAALAWTLLSLPVGALIGRTIRRADEAADAPFRTDAIERYLAEQARAPLS